MSDNLDSTTKTCTHCGEVKPATNEYFHKEKRRNGLRPICKICHNEKQQEWLAENMTPQRRKTRTETQRKSRTRHKGEINARDRVRNQQPERKKQRAITQREWYDNNKEYLRAYHAEYRLLNPHIHKAHSDRRRALKKNAQGFHTSADILVQIHAQTDRKGCLHCWWCGEIIQDCYHVDHRIALARGGSNWPNNLVISCPTCNLSKKAKTPQEWAGRLL